MSVFGWPDLFDPFELDHVVELVRDAHPGISDGLRNVLFPALDAYLLEQTFDHIGVEAAERLRDAGESVADQLDGLDWRDTSPETRDYAEQLAADLRIAWLEFIAAAGGHRMYDDLPKERAAKERQRRAGRKGVMARTPHRKLPPPEQLVAELDRIAVWRGIAEARSVLRQRYAHVATPQAINRALARGGRPGRRNKSET